MEVISIEKCRSEIPFLFYFLMFTNKTLVTQIVHWLLETEPFYKSLINNNNETGNAKKKLIVWWHSHRFWHRRIDRGVATLNLMMIRNPRSLDYFLAVAIYYLFGNLWNEFHKHFSFPTKIKIDCCSNGNSVFNLLLISHLVWILQNLRLNQMWILWHLISWFTSERAFS